MDSQTVERRAQHQPRLEDDPLVRGLGRYAADAPMAGQTQAYFVRSPHAFADIGSIETTAAAAVPGVLCVLTAADMDGIGNVSQHPPLAGRGREHAEHAGRGLGRGRVDRTDIGEGVRGTYKIGLGLPGHRRIGRIASEAAYQRIILQARLVLRAAFNGLRIHVGFLRRENSVELLNVFGRIGNPGQQSCHLCSRSELAHHPARQRLAVGRAGVAFRLSQGRPAEDRH